MAMLIGSKCVIEKSERAYGLFPLLDSRCDVQADCYSFAIVVSDLLLGLSTSPTVAPTKRIESIPFEAIQRACSRCADPVPSDRMGMTDILEAFRSLSESGRYAEYEACAPRRRVSRNARNDVMLV
eukprot:m.81294 g.81294  ORF g.81294 m.81294 type:complete len:126 (+) comp8220_c2_seq3:2103-2480(+)